MRILFLAALLLAPPTAALAQGMVPVTSGEKTAVVQAAAPVPLAPPSLAPRPMAPQPIAPRAPVPLDVRQAIQLKSGSGRLVSLSQAATSVFTADPKVADVRPASQTSLYVLGIAPGETTIAALDTAGHPIAQYRVVVTPSAFGADAASQAIARLVPTAHVSLAAVPGGLAVSGTAATPADAAEIMQIAQGYVGPKETVEDHLNVLADVQVSLQVRIAEMSRTITRELGVNWNDLGTTGGKIATSFFAPNSLALLPAAVSSFGFQYASGHTRVDGMLNALAQDQLARLLAEPNLTAMSGQTASFLVGGEYPIPVSQQNGTTTVQFQQYGVSLSFVPTVLANNLISLRVRPEVSSLTDQGAVTLNQDGSSLQIPALLVRRAETTVELGSGQSFAIAGLLQDQSSQTDSGIPGLSELPVLGALFNSNSFQRGESELVIIVTPYIVHPASSPAAFRLPTDGFRPASDLERILLHRQEALGSAPAHAPRIPGDAGFIVQ